MLKIIINQLRIVNVGERMAFSIAAKGSAADPREFFFNLKRIQRDISHDRFNGSQHNKTRDIGMTTRSYNKILRANDMWRRNGKKKIN